MFLQEKEIIIIHTSKRSNRFYTLLEPTFNYLYSYSSVCVPLYSNGVVC